MGDIWFSGKVFYIPIPVTIKVVPNPYEIQQVPSGDILIDEFWELDIFFKNHNQADMIINDIISSSKNLKWRYDDDYLESDDLVENILKTNSSRKLKLKFSHDVMGTHKFLIMIKTSLENFVIPLKIRVLDSNF